MPDPRFEFSNFDPCWVTLDTVDYPTVEHAYQASKFPVGHRMRQIIECHPSPGNAKKIGRLALHNPTFDKLAVMRDLLEQKFSQEPFRSRLLATGREPLCEWNLWHDNFWGECTCNRCSADMGLFPQNQLGQMLMEIRDSL